jgi:predicted DNA-binding transcriptional regulator AlpA
MVSARWGRHAIRPRSWARDMIATTGKPRSIKDLHRAVKVVAENTMNDPRPYRLVHERDLPTYAGLKRTQIAELIKRGEFPRSIRLSDGGRASIPTHAG